MDKRRYVSRHPRNPKSPIGMESAETGDPAVDGYTVRERQPLKRDRFGRDGLYGEHCAAESLMDEQEAMMRDLYGDD